MGKQKDKYIIFDHVEDQERDILVSSYNGIKITCRFTRDHNKHNMAIRGLKNFMLNT